MRSLFLIIILFYISIGVNAQTPAGIISDLKAVNDTVTNAQYDNGHGMLISNRAMNLFLSNKVSSYLSDINDLSFYKNNVLINSAKGTLAINHNFFQPKGSDEQVRSFLVVGAAANVVNTYAAVFSGHQFNNELGFTFKQTWIGKTITYFDHAEQKQLMDAQRAAILYSLENEIKKTESDFESTLNAIQPSDIPGQDSDTAKAGLRQKFYADLKKEYTRKFAEVQASALIETNHYKLISSNWTSISTYIPLFRQSFTVAESFTDNFESEHAYPWELTISHTRFRESKKCGKIFLTLYSRVYLNNSKQSNELFKTTSTEYKNLGGTDTLSMETSNTDELYIGSYQTFFTPAAGLKFVYFPGNSHIGASLMLEQNFGSYKVLNAKIGMPVVLIDKKDIPVANFEFRVQYFDISNKAFPEKKWNKKISAELTVGIPFSKIIY